MRRNVLRSRALGTLLVISLLLSSVLISPVLAAGSYTYVSNSSEASDGRISDLSTSGLGMIPSPYSVRIEGETETIWSGSVTVEEATITDDEGVSHHFDYPTALGALHEASQEGDFEYVVKNTSFGLYVHSIAGEDPEGLAGWRYWVDYYSPLIGAANFILGETTPPPPPHSEVLFAYGDWDQTPLKIQVNTTIPNVGETFSVTVRDYDDDTGDWTPTENATVYADDQQYTTGPDGTVDITIDTDRTLEVRAEKDGHIRSNRITVTVGRRFSMELHPGWNLVSIPVDPDPNHDGVHDIFSEIPVYTWNPKEGAYIVPETIEPGQGYWVAATQADTITITGDRLYEFTTEIDVGWNLMGSLYEPAKLSDLTVANGPDELRRHSIYWWNGTSYIRLQENDDLIPGRAYWLSSTETCDVTLQLQPPA